MKNDQTKHSDSMTYPKLTCANLPLATAYVRSQPYQNLNNPFQTLKQGTFFADLYDPYFPRKVAQGGRRHE